MKKVLHVGCGQKTIKTMGSGFNDGTWQEVSFDIDETKRPDIIGSIVNMEAVPDSSMDALWSCHNIEHVFHHEVPSVLSEFQRVLKDDGFCVITCPDVEEVCRRVVAGSFTETLYQSPAGPIAPLDVFYGHIASVARFQGRSVRVRWQGGIYTLHGHPRVTAQRPRQRDWVLPAAIQRRRRIVWSLWNRWLASGSLFTPRT